ncbi:MAG: hypothetical protein OXG37_00645 [Actinomycetia bacterium]|nr:hypothetical protein [Actinomycetes bacterium]
MTRNPGWERVTHTKKGAHPLHKDHYVWVVAEMSDEEGFAVTALTNRKPPTGHLIYQRQTWEH